MQVQRPRPFPACVMLPLPNRATRCIADLNSDGSVLRTCPLLRLLFIPAPADKTIKFWTWTVTTEVLTPQQPPADDGSAEQPPNKKHKKKHSQDDTAAATAAASAATVVRRLGFKLARQLEMADDVLSVVVSPDGRLLAASLLDATIKVYYTDR